MDAAQLLQAKQKIEPWCWTVGLKFQSLRMFTLTDAQMRVLQARGGILYRFPYPWVIERFALGLVPDIYVVCGAAPMAAFRAGMHPSVADYAVAYAAAIADLHASHTLWHGMPRDADTIGLAHRKRLETIRAHVGTSAFDLFLQAIHRHTVVASAPWHRDVLEMIHTESARLAPARLAELVSIGFATWVARTIAKSQAPMSDYPLHVAVALQLVTAARDDDPDGWLATMRSMSDVELLTRFYTADFCARFNFPRVEIMQTADANALKRILASSA